MAAPEQDYLTRYDVESLYCLGIQWNYQLHQLAFCSRAGGSESVQMRRASGSQAVLRPREYHKMK